ncbi:MAG: DUF6760 family protein [Cyanobacteria bacterium J06635_1]
MGGILGYPSDDLYGEVATIASAFHWSMAEIISLEHGDRRRWAERASRGNGLRRERSAERE